MVEQKIVVQDAPPKTVKIQQAKQNPPNKPNDKNSKIYIRQTKGPIKNLRRIILWIMMLTFAVIPWLTWNGDQAVLLDIVNQRFRIFGITFWPQDLTILAWIFMIGAFALFLVTTLYGRVWCGFTCPHTTWTFIFIWFEEKLEGTRHQRMRLDQKPMDFDKFWRKTTKHTAWVVIATLTALTFVGYFTDMRALMVNFFTLQASAWATGMVIFFAFCTYGNAGFMREIMCTHICPYSRIQSAMFDKDTFTVTYDQERGEPRGPRRRKADLDELDLGHCIDCELCVQVCPAGIDIRDGLQYECINCGACVDACNDVMDKMNYPRDLISFTTEHEMEGRTTKLFRFKSIGYFIVLFIMISLLVGNIAYRIPMEFDVIRDRNSLYRENQQGFIENVYRLRIINKSQLPEEYVFTVTAQGIDGVQWVGEQRIHLEGGHSEVIPISLAIDPYELSSPMTDITFNVQAQGDKRVKKNVKSNFIYQ